MVRTHNAKAVETSSGLPKPGRNSTIKTQIGTRVSTGRMTCFQLLTAQEKNRPLKYSCCCRYWSRSKMWNRQSVSQKTNTAGIIQLMLVPPGGNPAAPG